MVEQKTAQDVALLSDDSIGPLAQPQMRRGSTDSNLGQHTKAFETLRPEDVVATKHFFHNLHLVDKGLLPYDVVYWFLGRDLDEQWEELKVLGVGEKETSDTTPDKIHNLLAQFRLGTQLRQLWQREKASDFGKCKVRFSNGQCRASSDIIMNSCAGLLAAAPRILASHDGRSEMRRKERRQHFMAAVRFAMISANEQIRIITRPDSMEDVPQFARFKETCQVHSGSSTLETTIDEILSETDALHKKVLEETMDERNQSVRRWTIMSKQGIHEICEKLGYAVDIAEDAWYENIYTTAHHVMYFMFFMVSILICTAVGASYIMQSFYVMRNPASTSSRSAVVCGTIQPLFLILFSFMSRELLMFIRSSKNDPPMAECASRLLVAAMAFLGKTENIEVERGPEESTNFLESNTFSAVAVHQRMSAVWGHVFASNPSRHRIKVQRKISATCCLYVDLWFTLGLDFFLTIGGWTVLTASSPNLSASVSEKFFATFVLFAVIAFGLVVYTDIEEQMLFFSPFQRSLLFVLMFFALLGVAVDTTEMYAGVLTGGYCWATCTLFLYMWADVYIPWKEAQAKENDDVRKSRADLASDSSFTHGDPEAASCRKVSNIALTKYLRVVGDGLRKQSIRPGRILQRCHEIDNYASKEEHKIAFKCFVNAGTDHQARKDHTWITWRRTWPVWVLYTLAAICDVLHGDYFKTPGKHAMRILPIFVLFGMLYVTFKLASLTEKLVPSLTAKNTGNGFYHPFRGFLCFYIFTTILMWSSGAFSEAARLADLTIEDKEKLGYGGTFCDTPAPSRKSSVYPVCYMRWGAPSLALDVMDLGILSKYAYADTNATFNALVNYSFAHDPIQITHAEAYNYSDVPRMVYVRLLSGVNGSDETIVVAVKGTSSAKDAWLDTCLFAGIRTLQAMNLIIPLLDIMPNYFFAQMLNWERLPSVVQTEDGIINFGVNKVRNLISRHPNAYFVITGHSLGGAFAEVISSKLQLPSIIFSGPGDHFGRRIFHTHMNWTQRSVTSIYPDHDVVPGVDRQDGMVQKIQCHNTPAECHPISTTICELWRVCGDLRGRNMTSCRAEQNGSWVYDVGAKEWRPSHQPAVYEV